MKFRVNRPVDECSVLFGTPSAGIIGKDIQPEALAGLVGFAAIPWKSSLDKESARAYHAAAADLQLLGK